MAELKTTLSNIYEPTIWNNSFLQMTTEKSALVESGIAVADPDVQAAADKAGRLVEMPFWNDLPASDSSLATTSDDTIVATGLTQGEDKCYKLFRTKAWNASPLVEYAEGQDPAQIALARYANYWAREEQRIMLKILGGVFSDATIAAALQNDISKDTVTDDAATLISSTAVENTRFLLGDAFGKFKAIAMHSVPFKRLRNLDLIDFVPASAQNPMGEQIPYYMGMRVLVDDTMTKTAVTGGYKYDTYLFGDGALARVNVAIPNGKNAIAVVDEELKGTGAGSTTVLTRRYFILHPRGIAFNATPAGFSPSDAELAADNWTKVYDTKNIRIARLRTNG